MTEKSIDAGYRARERSGMRLIRGGTFRMGSDDFYQGERPVRNATVNDFWIDETPVTNAQFARFIEDTGYVTFAELPPDPAMYPDIDPALAHPGSAVFMPPGSAVSISRATWWSLVLGASWKHPLGPGSDISGMEDHPVVHVAYEDAAAYAHWGSKHLPSEREWEYAARAGLDGKPYAWGEEFEPNGMSMAKTWQGIFPYDNRARAGFERTVPVRSYPPNGYGLYDMIGNVWEWTDDWYDKRMVVKTSNTDCCGGEIDVASDPTDAQFARRVAKGGLHLCAINYCQRYRPAARWPQPIDTSTSHLGFRCVIRGSEDAQVSQPA